MSSEGDTPVADYDENTSGYQDDARENYLGTQIEDSNDVVHEDIDIDYDPYSMLEEASPVPTTNAREQSNYQAPHISEDREESIHETVDNDRLSVRHTSPLRDRTESPQTSQGPSPTQRSRESTHPLEVTSPAVTNSREHGAQEQGLQNFNYAHSAMNNGSKSPVVKMEEQDEDVCFIRSNTLEEPIIISDDEDMVEPKSGNRTIVIDAVQHQSSDPTANHLAPRTDTINMGNSILRTARQKRTKSQLQKMKQAQQTLAKLFNPKLVTGGAGTVFKGTAGQGPVGSGVVNALKEAAVAASTDENAWMNEEMDDSDDSVNSVTIYKLKRKIAGKAKKNQSVLREEIELINAEKKLAIRNRRHRIDVMQEGGGDNDSLFVAEDGNEHKKRKIARDAFQQYYSNHIRGEYDLDFDDTADKPDSGIAAETTNGSRGGEPEAEQQRPIADEERVAQDLLMAMADVTNEDSEKKKPKKKRSGVAKTAKEAHKKNRSKVKVTKASGTSKTKTKTGKNANISKNSKATSVKVSEKKKKTAKRATGGYGTSGDGSALLMDLLHNNAMRDRMAQGDLGEAPIIGEKKNKDRMLSELIASVPTEHKRHVTNDKKDLLQASRNFGYGKVVADEGKWRLKGMRSPLYHHQLLGADFMVGRECGTVRPFGGLLADAMGLGKTLQMLATMVGNPPTAQEASVSKITLLVVPSGVIRQWQEEIARHVKPEIFKKIMHYKAIKEISLEILRDCDILITSYAEVMNSYPWPDQEEMETLTASTVSEWSKKNYEKRCGVLHRLTYYRVVLDEAHIIRNYRSRTSIACVNLQADLRWALTGTPILNRLEELYPYFRFLSVNYAPNFLTFKKEYCDPKSEECQQRVLSLLSYMMIRRTLQDKIFDRPIVELPKTHAEVKKIDFSKEERALYQILEDRFRRDFNSYFEAGTAQKNYRNVVVKLLRLRQCTAHPFLLRQTIKDIFTLEDLRNLEARLASANMEKRPIYDRIGLWLKDAGADKEASQGKTPDANTPAASLDSDGGINFGKSNFGSTFDFAKYLSTLNERELLSRCICGICADVADDPTITDCRHVFCRQCIQTECNKAAAQSNFTECPVCNSAFGSAIPFEELRAKLDVPSLSSEGEESQTEGRRRRKGDKRSYDPWLDAPGEMLPSAKTIAFKQQVLQWQEEAPNDKIVVFTQFHLMAKIIAKICEAEGWPHVLYTGDMTTQARHRAVQEFGAQDSELRIMIAGLKCGGQGLNLTMANRVISIDLWWNHSVELQAFGRVFRIGQHKETQLTRLVVRNTVDDRLLKMQDDKLRVVEGVMMDDGRAVKSLSVDELASLFGFLRKDEEGNPVLEPHEDDPEPVDDPAQPSQAE